MMRRVVPVLPVLRVKPLRRLLPFVTERQKRAESEKKTETPVKPVGERKENVALSHRFEQKRQLSSVRKVVKPR